MAETVLSSSSASSWQALPCRLVKANARNGYRRVSLPGGRSDYAHRIAYETEVGPIPTGMHIDHLCNHKTCIETRHMEPVAPGENIRRAWERGDHGPRVDTSAPCKRGHAPNWYRPKNRRWRAGWRCKTCWKEDRLTKIGLPELARQARVRYAIKHPGVKHRVPT